MTQKDYLTSFYVQYAGFVIKRAAALCSSAQDIEDIVQTVWVQLIAKEETLKRLEQGMQLSYIATTVTNTVRSEARRKRLTICSLDAAVGVANDSIGELDEALDQILLQKHFRKAWNNVPEDVRELLERKYVLYETDAEIAHAMQIKASSVRMYLTRARRTAMKILAESGNQLSI